MGTKRKNSSISRVDSLSTQSQSDKRRKKTVIYDAPNDCWYDSDLPQNQKLYVDDRICKKASNYHDPGHECHKFDDYVSEICHPSCRKTALGPDFYKKVNLDDSGIMYILFPLQHMFGDIDILKTKLSKKEKKILSGFELIRRPSGIVKETLKKRESKKKRDKRVDPRLPAKFDEWPKSFTLIHKEDNFKVKSEKKTALRECLNRRISFMKDCVYDCGTISERYLKIHLDFIVSLQILAAKLDA